MSIQLVNTCRHESEDECIHIRQITSACVTVTTVMHTSGMLKICPKHTSSKLLYIVMGTRCDCSWCRSMFCCCYDVSCLYFVAVVMFIRIVRGSPTVAKSRTPYLKSHLKSLKSLKFQNLKSRTVETVISKFLYISASNHVKIRRTISNKLLVR